VNEANSVGGIHNARGHVEPHQGRPIATDRVSRVSNADRHRYGEIADRRGVFVVISPQTPCDRSDERVI
jgi:hypothetical protein